MFAEKRKISRAERRQFFKSSQDKTIEAAAIGGKILDVLKQQPMWKDHPLARLFALIPNEVLLTMVMAYVTTMTYPLPPTITQPMISGFNTMIDSVMKLMPDLKQRVDIVRSLIASGNKNPTKEQVDAEVQRVNVNLGESNSMDYPSGSSKEEGFYTGLAGAGGAGGAMTAKEKTQHQATSTNSGWENYVAKTPGGEKVKALWESKTPQGYSAEYMSFVKWYKDTNPSFFEKNGKNISVSDVEGLLSTPVAAEEKPAEQQAPVTSDQASRQDQSSSQPQEAHAAIKPTSQAEIEGIIRNLNTNVISGISVNTQSGIQKLPTRGNVSAKIRKRIAKSGGEEKVAAEIWAKYGKKFNDELQVLADREKEAGRDFSQVRTSMLAGLVYNAINDVWVSAAKTRFGGGRRERAVEREKRRRQRDFDKLSR